MNILQNIFSVKNIDIHKVVTVFGIKLKFKSEKLEQRVLLQLQKEQEEREEQERVLFNIRYNEILMRSKNNTLIVYFDHSLGGGTETYFFNQLSELFSNVTLLRIQYFLHNESYKITLYNCKDTYEIEEIDFTGLSKIINKLKFNKIILNNIVGYPNVKSVLDLISNYKRKFPSTEIVVKGHDFYSICPEWNLLNHKNEYCNIETSDIECQKCFDKISLKCDDIKKEFSIYSWRELWNDFYIHTVDILEVFSPSSKNIFSKAYPEIIDKIIVNPHKIKPFPKYNICVLGAFCVNKGSCVVENLIKYLEANKIYDYNFIVVGVNWHTIESDLCSFEGKYSRNRLPIILKNNNIDLVLIPSIWPETFCYTVAEAIALDYPVACFDMGGQADQVKQYKKGEILSSFEPEIIEKELRAFLEKRKT